MSGKHCDADALSLSRRSFLTAAAVSPLLLCLPRRAVAASSIHELEGQVYINNRLATHAAAIRAGDEVVVAHGGRMVMSIGGDAFLLRQGTVLEVVGQNNPVVSGLRLVTGALLAVFEKRRRPAYIVTSTATIGIRGTAVYLSAEPHKLYTCTCYGKTDLRFGKQVEQISATHHNAHEVSADASGHMSMISMEVIDHTDDELRMLESYVGRKPAFDL